MFRRYFATGDQNVLEAATRALREITDAPTDSPDLAQQLNSLGADLRVQFKQTDDPAVLEAAMVAYEKSLKVAQPASGDLPSLLSSLALGLIDRFELTAHRADIDRAVDAADEAVRRASPGDRWLTFYRINLAKALITRQEAAANDNDLDRAAALVAAVGGIRSVAEGDRAVSDAPVAPALAEVQALIGRALVRRHERSDGLEDLDAGIENLRSAAANAAVPLLSAIYAADLSIGLIERFRKHGRLDDADEAARVCQDALDHVQGDLQAPPRVIATLKRNLGMAVRSWYEFDPDPDKLQRVVQISREALAQTPSGTPGRFRYLTNLANSLADRQKQLGNPLDLEEAIGLYEQALAEADATGPERETALLDLGLALLDRFLRHHRPEDLQCALAKVQRGLEWLPVGSAKRPIVLNQLGLSMVELFDVTHRKEDLERGVAAFRESCVSGSMALPAHVVKVARNWGRWAAPRSSWAEAAEAYRYGVAAMLRSVAAETRRGHKEVWIAHAQGIPAAAAYALAQVGELKEAVLALERGRTVLLSEALERQGRLARSDSYRIGFAGVAAAAERAPLAYVLATPQGGLALIVRASKDDHIERLWLDELTEEALGRQIMSYVEAYARAGDEPMVWRHALDDIGAWLWDSVMAPLVRALSAAGEAALIPVGLLNLLPLHAAWRPDSAAPGGRRYAIDDLGLSYAPNAGSLLAVDRTAEGGAGASVLVVDDPQPADAPVLRHASREVEAALAGSTRKLRLRKQKATREAVLDALGDYSVVHFACHGMADPAHPLASALLVAPLARLTLADILSRNLGTTRLAVLSACETSLAGIPLPDEVINLAAGFLQAGVAGVVGSMWSVNDTSTSILMCRFYELWRQDALEPREALRRAQQWVRDASNRTKWQHFPQFQELSPPDGLSRVALDFWGEAHAHAHPYCWAGFAYVGL